MDEKKSKKVADVSEPIATTVEATPVSSNPVQAPAPVKKGGFGWGKCCLVGCLLMFLCCICTVVVALVAPNLLITTVLGGNKGPDPTLTRIANVQELKTLDSAITSELENNISVDPITGLPKLILNEKQAIAFLYSVLGINTPEKPMSANDISKLGLKFSKDKVRLEVDLSLLFSSVPTSNTQNFDPKIFEGVNISIELGTTADNKSMVFTDFSTGNNVIDSVLSGFKPQIISSIQSNIEDSMGGTDTPSEFSSFTFLPGSIEIVFANQF